MGTCNVCGATGSTVRTEPCFRCEKNLCPAHRMYVPVVREIQLIQALQGNGSRHGGGDAGRQTAMVWMTNPAAAPKNWQEYRIFCQVGCVNDWMGTLTPNTIQGPNGPLPVLTFSEAGVLSPQTFWRVDGSRFVDPSGVYAVVETNLPPEARKAFEYRASGMDVRNAELSRARNAWAAGNFSLAAEIFDRQGYPAEAAKARELASTKRVVQTTYSVSLDFNRMMEQLKDFRRPVAYSCPVCGAAFTIDGNTSLDKLKCGYCGTTFQVTDVTKAVRDLIARFPPSPPK